MQEVSKNNTVVPSGLFDITFAIPSKQGYTCIGVVGYSIGNRTDIKIAGVFIQVATVHMVGMNSTSQFTTSPFVQVLYVKS